MCDSISFGLIVTLSFLQYSRLALFKCNYASIHHFYQKYRFSK